MGLDPAVQTQPKSASLSDARLLYALEAAAMVAYEWTIATDAVIQSPNADRILGLPLGTTLTTGAEFFQLIHPDDRAETIAQIDAAFANETEYRAEFRLVCPDGVTRWLSDRGQPSFDPITRSRRLCGVIQDISEAKFHEAERKQVEAFNLQILESSPDCLKVLDLQGRLLYMNQNGQHLMSICDFQDCLNANWIEFWQGSDRQAAQQALLAAKSGKTSQFRGNCATLSGIPKWWDVIVAPIFDADGRVERLLSISRDITDRQQAEAELRASEERARLAIDVARLGTWRYTIDTGLVELDARMREIWGESAEVDEIPLTQVIERIHADDRATVAQAIGAAIDPASDGRYEVEYRIVWLNGAERWISANGQVQFEGAGATRKAVTVVGTALDITERKRADAELRVTEQRLQTMIDNTSAAIFIKDVSGHYLLMNRECGRLFNLTNAEVNGKTDDDLFPPALAESIRENDRQVFAAGTALTFEESVRFADGVHTYVAIKFPLFDADGVAYAIAGISTDITDRKRLEQALKAAFEREQAAREAAEQANRLKDEFLAVLSHELRSPLNPILGWVKLLRSRRVDESRVAEALATIERNAQLQAQLIEDLLDISRIMRGKLTLNATPVSLAFVVSAAIETVRLAAEAKTIQLIVSLDSAVKPVYGDSSRLQQVVWNLLSNAVKFTPAQGRVDVRLRQIGDRAELQISDTGKGINLDFLPYIFEHFRQEDGATTRKFGGLGLGLAIARQLVELHGGTIRAESQGENQGATFTVWLPLLKQDIPIQPPVQSNQTLTALNGIQALIVDDDDDTREFLTFLLQQNGAIVQTANSATAALQALRRSQPDILLSDIGMPETDGYGLIQKIRAAAYQFPAIALTAYAGEFNQQQALQAGFQHHIAKPIDPDAVIAIVDQLTR